MTSKTWYQTLRLPIPYKVFEVQFATMGYNGLPSWFECNLKHRKHCDHAGFFFVLSLLKLFYFEASIYDTRHWDRDNNRFEEIK